MKTEEQIRQELKIINDTLEGKSFILNQTFVLTNHKKGRLSIQKEIFEWILNDAKETKENDRNKS